MIIYIIRLIIIGNYNKNKIQRKNYDNNNDNINNKEYYSVSIDKINKKSKTKKLVVYRPNIYNKTIDSLLNREIL